MIDIKYVWDKVKNYFSLDKTRLSCSFLLDKVIRSVFRLVEDAAQILTDDAQTDELYRPKEEHNTDECGKTRYRVAIEQNLDQGV